MYQMLQRAFSCFVDTKFSNSSIFYHLERSLYPPFPKIVEAMHLLNQERHNHTEKYSTVKVSRITGKVDNYLANEESDLEFLITDLRYIFKSNVCLECGVCREEIGVTK